MTDAVTFPPDTALPCAVHPSPNHGDRRGRKVDSLVLHYTGMRTASAALARLCDPAAEVSAHYLVDEDGRVFQLVPEGRRAWHAGQSFWQGEQDMNSVSVGIEIANVGHDGGLPPFPDGQVAATIALCQDIMGRLSIDPERVLGHSDIAPGRKVDPGPLFPWRRCADAGVGVWPDPADASAGLILAVGARGRHTAALHGLLCDWGTDAPRDGSFDERTRVLVNAFQLRFRPSCVDGVADPETVALLHALTRKCDKCAAPDRRSS